MNHRKQTTFAASVIAAALLCAPTVRAAEDADTKVQALIDKGLAYLKTQQQPNGSWQRTEREPVGISALVLRAYVQDTKHNAKTDFVAKGFENLLSYQTTDGGIYKSLLANYNTAICVSTLVKANDPAFKPAIDKAVAYLKTLQWTEETKPEYPGKEGEKVPETNQGKQVVTGLDDPFYGGWGYGGRSRGGGRPDLSNTQFAIEALKDGGVANDDPALQNALKFVSRCQNHSETNDQPWAGNDGGFVYGPSDDRKGESMAGATEQNGQRQLRSMGTMSYAGLKSLVYAGVDKNDPRVKAVWKWVNNNFTLEENVGLAAADPNKSRGGMFYGYLAIAKALAAYGEPILTTDDGKKTDWRLALIDKAAAIQNPDGSWIGDKGQMEDNPILVTSYVVLALQEAQKDLKAHPVK